MMLAKPAVQHSPVIALLLAALLLPACSDATKNSHDFNELVPRILGAIKNRSPEDAAANLFNVTNPDERRDAIAIWTVSRPQVRNALDRATFEALIRAVRGAAADRTLRAIVLTSQGDTFVSGGDLRELRFASRRLQARHSGSADLPRDVLIIGIATLAQMIPDGLWSDSRVLLEIIIELVIFIHVHIVV